MSGYLARPAMWELIAPAVPDSLEELGNGQYVAKWWKPVPMQDVEELLQTDGIKIHRGPYEPRNLPEGLAIQFSVDQDTSSDDFGHADDDCFPVESRRRATLPLQKTGS